LSAVACVAHARRGFWPIVNGGELAALSSRARREDGRKPVGDAVDGCRTVVATTLVAFAAMVEAAMKSAPAGSEQAVALWKSAFEGATNGYEALQKAAKQASEVAQANYAAASTSVAKATKAPRA
jgi:hypothetical protein